MKLQSIFFVIFILSVVFATAQTNLGINDIIAGLDSSYKIHMNKFYKGEVFHIKENHLPFLYDIPVADDSLLKVIIVSKEDSIKKYFSKEDFKNNSEKIVIEFSIISISSDTIFINVKNLIMTAGHFNKKRRELIGYTGQTKLYALYDRKLNKWVVDKLNKCTRCPDQ